MISLLEFIGFVENAAIQPYKPIHSVHLNLSFYAELFSHTNKYKDQKDFNFPQKDEYEIAAITMRDTNRVAEGIWED